MNDLLRTLLEYSGAVPGLTIIVIGFILLVIFGNWFAKLQKNSFDQTSRIQEANFKQIQIVVKSTSELNKDTALLVAEKVGSKIAESLSDNLSDQKSILTQLKNTLDEMRQEIKERYEKNQTFNASEFAKIENQISLLLGITTPNKSVVEVNLDQKQNFPS